MSSTYGENFRLTIFGQSHGPAIGVTMEGLPAGFPIDLEALQAFLDRRAPGRRATATARREGDRPVFLSGLVRNITCSAPLTAVIANTDPQSEDYAPFRDCPRPGHGDYTAQVKFHGAQDAAGGGPLSGRLTAPLCIAGGICLQLLAREGVAIAAHIQSIGEQEDLPFDPQNVDKAQLRALLARPFPVLREASEGAMTQTILAAKAAGDSVGGVIECAAVGLPPGWGDPIFGGMENRIAQAASWERTQRRLLSGAESGPDPNQSSRRHSGRHHQRHAPCVPGGHQAHPLHPNTSGQRLPVPHGAGQPANLRPARPLHRASGSSLRRSRCGSCHL